MKNSWLQQPVGKVERTYDELQRETVHKVYSNSNSENHLRSETTYVNLDENRTTQLVSEYNHYVGTSDSDKNVLDGYTSFRYTYDDNGNISSIVEKEGNATRTRTYEYDALNQLVRENDEAQGKSITYSYDNCGNLLSKTEYLYTNGTLGTAINTFYYSYENSEWKDLLTSYEGQSITYDAIGNPLMYYDGTSFTWTQGRRLSSATLSDGTVITYKYDTQGRRIGKVVGETETEYFVDDAGTVYAMKQGEEKLVFMYDATGRREGFRWYTGTQDNGAYYYVYNLQGDVIGIIASDLELVVLYEYDSWGKVLNVSGTKAATLGQINPFCYRGYCYDADTGFYYVSSRYYDPEIGRFINADGYVSTGQDITGFNMFAYCGNNPVNRIDPTGQFWSSIVSFVKSAASAIGKAIASKAPVYAGLGTAALADGPAPIVDAIAAIGALAITATTIVQGINQTIKVKSVAKEKEEEKVVATTKPSSSSTPIYRYGGTNPGNLIPTRNDALLNSGLSFSTVPKPGAAMTTVEAINSTGVLIAIQDGPTHVSVYPIGTTVAGWRMAGTDSIWTQTLKSIVIKWY